MNPLQQQQAVFKIGLVSEIDPSSCTARVRFDDLDGLETMRLPVGVQKSLKDKSYWMPDVGEHVACLLDVNAEAGVILCAIYSGQDRPPVDHPDKKHVRFDDGSWFEYDRAEHFLQVHCVGDLLIHAEGSTRIVIAGHADVQVGGNASVQVNGWVQIIAQGRMLIKSLTRLILDGPSRKIVL